jgi:predicted TPR repeat methyltransferase
MQQVNQLSTCTRYNRYPEIFAEIRSIIKEDDISIISFGCSSGLEMKTLRELYFTTSVIDGCDISELMIEDSKKKNTDEKMHYFNSKTDKLKELNYDLVFCMSVLCRWLSEPVFGIYTFEAFDNTLIDIDKCLKLGGYVCIYNSKYAFTDSSVSNKYEPVKTDYQETGFVTKYLPDGKTIISNYPYFLFKKISLL